LKKADINAGSYYIGGKWARIREVLVAHDWWVDWRDIDPETVDAIDYFPTKTGSCSPKAFAAWGKRRVEREEVEARLAMPVSERRKLAKTRNDNP
jgi:hypothetical protein